MAWNRTADIEPNKAHALRGGIPPLFHAGGQRPAGGQEARFLAFRRAPRALLITGEGFCTNDRNAPGLPEPHRTAARIGRSFPATNRTGRAAPERRRNLIRTADPGVARQRRKVAPDGTTAPETPA